MLFSPQTHTENFLGRVSAMLVPCLQKIVKILSKHVFLTPIVDESRIVLRPRPQQRPLPLPWPWRRRALPVCTRTRTRWTLHWPRWLRRKPQASRQTVLTRKQNRHLQAQSLRSSHPSRYLHRVYHYRVRSCRSHLLSRGPPPPTLPSPPPSCRPPRSPSVSVRFARPDQPSRPPRLHTHMPRRHQQHLLWPRRRRR